LLISNWYLKNFELIKQEKDYNIKIRNNRFHSIHLDQEIERIINQIPQDIENLLLIGAGNGKIIQNILNQKKIKVILIEPIKNFEYLQKLFYYKDINYVHDYKDLANLNTLYISIYPVYKRLFPSLIDNILAFLENDINKKTFYKFLYTWIINYKKNLENKIIYFVHKLNIKKNKILFCGSGITLMEDLKKHNLKDYYIIASDSSVIPLLKNDIPIDLIISVDPTVGTLYHFYLYKEKLKNISLLTWLGGRADLNNLFKKRYFLLTSFPIDQWISQYNKDLLILNSPANDVLDYAKQLAQIYQKPLYLAGCGIKNHKMYYYPNTGYDYYALLKNDRVFTNEHYHYFLYKNQSYKRKNFNFNVELATQIKSEENNQKEFIPIDSKSIKEYLNKNKINIINKYKFLNLLFEII
jgi:hypothetical protein